MYPFLSELSISCKCSILVLKLSMKIFPFFKQDSMIKGVFDMHCLWSKTVLTYENSVSLFQPSFSKRVQVQSRKIVLTTVRCYKTVLTECASKPTWVWRLSMFMFHQIRNSQGSFCKSTTNVISVPGLMLYLDSITNRLERKRCNKSPTEFVCNT